MMNYRETYKRLFASGYNEPPNAENHAYVTDWIDAGVWQTGSIVDIGSGKGNLLKLLLDRFEPEQITSCDLEKFHDVPVEFVPIDLSKGLAGLQGRRFDLAICTDVMEHLDRGDLETALSEISRMADRFVFTIASHSSQRNGVELHLTIEPFPFWNALLERHYRIVDSKTMKDGHLFGFVMGDKQ